MKPGWSEQAKAELREIRTYSAGRWGKRIAVEYLQAINVGAARAANDPDRLRPLKEGFWQLRARSHVLVIRIDVAAQEMLVLRVLHASMDIDRHLPKLAKGQSFDSFD